MRSFSGIMIHALPIIISFGISLSGCRSKLDQIYEPVFTGRPTDNAFNGLVQLPDGEIRHYGFEGSWDNPESHVYTYSKNNGLSWKKKVITDPDLFTNENMPPAVLNPLSGDYIRLICNKTGTWFMKSKIGIDGPFEKKLITSEHYQMIRQPVFLSGKERIIVACGRSIIHDDTEVMQSCVFYSDDHGENWSISFVPVGPRFIAEWPHKKPRWQNYAIEPTIIELNDGRLWMLLRTSMDRLYESFSSDHGSSWSEPGPSRFYSTITMPTLFRLKDGRLMLFFCNTTPLPEEDRTSDTNINETQKNGLWEDVFTNRDAIHAAISEDDGKTWKGFRELYLNPLRNENDFATRGGKEVSLDKSVHQSQAIELPHGKVLLAFGQHPLVRAMIIFDPDWLTEKTRSDNLKDGLVNWSTFKYLNGIKGHCAYNRDPGAPLVDDPERKGNKVIQINHELKKEFVCDVDGAVWNFPAGSEGSFKTSIYPENGGLGGRISLIDRWFNPTDTLAYRYSVYTVTFDGNGNTSYGPLMEPGRWNEILLSWDDLQAGECKITVNGKPVPYTLPLNRKSQNGINYVHFQSVPVREDMKGFLIGPVNASVTGNQGNDKV